MIRPGSPVDRRTLLRASAAAGIALPFGVPALAAQDASEHATPDDGYVGSDPHSPTTGEGTPSPSAVKEFVRFDPYLEPVRPGPVDLHLNAEDATLYIAEDVPFAAWTFNGTIPSPVFHVPQGEQVNFTFTIDADASTGHSVDFHSAQTAPDVNYKTIFPGEEFSWSFTPKYPGAFMYHCGTAPVLMHIGTGMFGAMIVRPEGGWPTEAQEIVLIQNDFYVKEEEGSETVVFDYWKAYDGYPVDYTAFNGHTTQYVDEPIRVEAGKPIRIYVVNAGPNVSCTFHVVGGIFDAVYFNANPANKIVGQQSMTIGPGDGMAFELTLDEPGLYPAVNHAFGHAAHGAIALLQAE